MILRRGHGKNDNSYDLIFKNDMSKKDMIFYSIYKDMMIARKSCINRSE